jgi:hypothetical protein
VLIGVNIFSLLYFFVGFSPRGGTFFLSLVGIMIVGEMDVLLVVLVGYFAYCKTLLTSLGL